tara:strand:- start:37 stop:510 length:474 start_codon:yes stop_codon:yes gene_type:complete
MKNEGESIPEEFYNYITEPVTVEDMRLWVRHKNIDADRAELFYDFIDSVHTVLHETFLGDDVIINEEDKQKHFKWCWNKTIDNFKEENILFNTEGDHYEYFWNFFYESYYTDKEKRDVDNINNYFLILTKLHILKTKSELDMLSDIYILLDSNLTVN